MIYLATVVWIVLGIIVLMKESFMPIAGSGILVGVLIALCIGGFYAVGFVCQLTQSAMVTSFFILGVLLLVVRCLENNGHAEEGIIGKVLVIFVPLITFCGYGEMLDKLDWRYLMALIPATIYSAYLIAKEKRR